jgi:hypothetical protein
MKLEEIFARKDDFVEEYDYKFKALGRSVVLDNKLCENPNVPVDLQAKLSLFGGGS